MDMAGSRVRCTKRSVRIARKSAKYLLSQTATARFTAEIAIQRERIAGAKRESRDSRDTLLNSFIM